MHENIRTVAGDYICCSNDGFTATDADIRSVSTLMPVNTELLCFITDKGKSMAFDHLVKLVTDFYSEDELMAAKSLLDNYTGTGSSVIFVTKIKRELELSVVVFRELELEL